MPEQIEVILFYLLLVDSIGANTMAWFGDRWYAKHFRVFSRYFPAAKGWCAYYFVLVLWAGTLLFRAGVLF